MDLQYKPWSGVGVTNFFRRNAVTGAIVGGGYDMGENSVLTISQQAPKLEMNTSRSSDRGLAFSMAQAKTGSLTIELRTVNDFVWGLLTSGSWSNVAAVADVENWAAPVDLAALQVIKLPHENVSAVVITDSTVGAAKTLPEGQYEVDPLGGTIKLLDITTGAPYVQPFRVSYTPGAVQVLGGLKAPEEDFIVQFNGTNSYDGTRQCVEVFKYRFGGEGELPLIQNEIGTFTLNGSIQKDETKAANGVGGQYYRMWKPAAA